jgi:aryl-alcohol dehydrogenase-like predicted oxidoreductase
MNYRLFGQTDLRVSEIGLSCASLAGGLYYKNDRESIMTLRQAFDSGINFFETSDSWGQGDSERLIGQALRGKRDSIIIAGRVGIVFSTLGNLALRMRVLARPASRLLRPMSGHLYKARTSQKRKDFSSKHLTEAIHGSLKRLQTDYLDLYQLYRPPSSVLEEGDFCETFEKLKAQGKLRYYGVVCDTVKDALICLRLPGISSIQVDISLLDQEAITKVLPLASEKKLAVIAGHPRAMGLLTNNLSDIMGDTSSYDRTELENRKKRAKSLRFLIKEDRALAQAALRFVLQLDGVSVVLPRALDRHQLEENLGALIAAQFTTEELAKIYSIGSR